MAASRHAAVAVRRTPGVTVPRTVRMSVVATLPPCFGVVDCGRVERASSATLAMGNALTLEPPVRAGVERRVPSAAATSPRRAWHRGRPSPLSRSTCFRAPKLACPRARDVPLGARGLHQETLVAARQRNERCARPHAGCLRAVRPEEGRPLAEALGRAQRPSQERPVPLGDVDAHLLHQPRWHTLGDARNGKLERAKDELRALFGKRPHVGEASKTPAKAAAKGPR